MSKLLFYFAFVRLELEDDEGSHVREVADNSLDVEEDCDDGDDDDDGEHRQYASTYKNFVTEKKAI